MISTQPGESGARTVALGGGQQGGAGGIDCRDGNQLRPRCGNATCHDGSACTVAQTTAGAANSGVGRSCVSITACNPARRLLPRQLRTGLRHRLLVYRIRGPVHQPVMRVSTNPQAHLCRSLRRAGSPSGESPARRRECRIVFAGLIVSCRRSAQLNRSAGLGTG
jgi:hypothetical protein